MPDSRTDEEPDDFSIWPSFVDLLSATSLLFITLVAVFIFIAYQHQQVIQGELEGMRTELQHLTDALEQTPAASNRVYTVHSDSQFVRLRIKEAATFPRGEYLLSTMREPGRSALREIGDVLKDTAIARLFREVRVIGHSDSVPYSVPDFSNWELSAARAAVVARYLVNGVGVNPCKISASGVGPYYPMADIDPGLTPAAQNEQNRRIEIEIVPARAAGKVEGRPCDSYGDGTAPGVRQQ